MYAFGYSFLRKKLYYVFVEIGELQNVALFFAYLYKNKLFYVDYCRFKV